MQFGVRSVGGVGVFPRQQIAEAFRRLRGAQIFIGRRLQFHHGRAKVTVLPTRPVFGGGF